MLLLIELQINLTIWTIVSLAVNGLGKVEEGERQGEKEKNQPSHLQKADLGGTVFMDLVNRRKSSLSIDLGWLSCQQ